MLCNVQAMLYFSVAGEELFIQKVDLKAESVTYGNGTVDWTIRCDKQSIHVSGEMIDPSIRGICVS